MKAARADENYIEIKRRFLAEGQRFVLVRWLGEEGFDSRTGAEPQYREGKLIVDAGGTLHGTTLNDALDEKILERALLCMAAQSGETLTVDSAKLTFEYVAPSPKLIIVGATSVGLAIERIASGLDFTTVLVDESDREQAAEGGESGGLDGGAASAARLKSLKFDEATYIVVAHPLDYLAAMRYCLDMPWAYFGVLGSRQKIEELWKNLSALGVSDTLRAKVHAPLGFDIGAQTPEEIAIAALAEIIAVKNGAPRPAQ